MGIAPDDEARLIELAMAGDFDSFAALYTCYLNPIYRYIYYRTADPQDAEDLTEQVFLKAWEALPNYRRVGRCFINWLYRISHNTVVDHHRSQKWIASDALPLDDVSSTHTQDTALDAVILEEEASSLAAAVHQLPEEYQQVIILRFIEGLGHSEVAQILEKSEAACRAIQHRALVSLNRCLTGVRERG